MVYCLSFQHINSMLLLKQVVHRKCSGVIRLVARKCGWEGRFDPGQVHSSQDSWGGRGSRLIGQFHLTLTFFRPKSRNDSNVASFLSHMINPAIWPGEHQRRQKKDNVSVGHTAINTKRAVSVSACPTVPPFSLHTLPCHPTSCQVSCWIFTSF